MSNILLENLNQVSSNFPGEGDEAARAGTGFYFGP